MRIDIIASTYPTGYQFLVTDRTSSNNELARRFLSSLAIEDDIFTSTFSRWMGEQVPVYEMYSTNRKYEIRLVPQGDFSAPIVYIKYQVAKLNGTNNEYYTSSMEYQSLQASSNQGDNSRYDIGMDMYLKYTKDSVNGGISLVVDQLPSNGETALY
jgi:hypothetical protein